MPIALPLTDEEIQTLAEMVLSRELGESGFDHAEIRSGEDHDGAAAIFVKALLHSGKDVLAPGVFTRAYEVLDQTLQSHGETRFPYFSVERIDEEAGEDLTVNEQS